MPADKRRLIYSIVQFLNKELNSDEISEDAKESLEVASQCLQTAYCMAPEDTHLEVSKSLEELFHSATQSEPVSKYFKVSIIRPGRSMLLEFEKNIVLVV